MVDSGDKINHTRVGGYLLIGSIFLGIGIGMYLGSPKIGSIIGLCVGFLAMAATKLRSNK